MKKKINTKIFIALSCLVLIVIATLFIVRKKEVNKEVIHIGILHSQTGNMAISESPIVNGILLAIQEINESGGLLGKLLEPTIVDGKSDEKVFAKAAEQLINKHKVSVIFGCWTSSSRKAVKEVVEKYNNLLMYPAQYEGLENSPNIIYSGAAPNQQIIPSITWCLRHLGKKCYLVGSDFIYPRSANETAKDYLKMVGGEVVGESYQVLDSSNFKDIVENIKKTKPDFIINTISGQSNSAFFSTLNNAGIKSKDIPVMSYSINEADLISTLNLNDMVGHYACTNYFESIATKVNKDFVAKFKARFGSSRVINDPIETAYFNVYLWAKAVNSCQDIKPSLVIQAIKNEGIYAPEGAVFIDPENQHAWKISRIGKINKAGKFDIVWQSRKPVRPEPFPRTRSQKEWQEFTEKLYKNWNNKWESGRK